MNILVISSYLPFPLHSGGQVRLYNLIKELSDKHTITLICEMRPHQTVYDVEQVEKICKKVITVPRRKQWTPKNIFKSSFTEHSFLVTGHTSEMMRQEIEKVIAHESFDVMHVETFYVLQNVPEVSIPIVLVEHNIEYQVYQRFVDKQQLPLRPLLGVDIAKIRKEEEASWKRAKTLVAVSEEDKKVMEKNGRHPIVVANGVDTDFFYFKNISQEFIQTEKKILFLGDFTWMQNTDSATFIIRHIWPELKKRGVGIKLWIVGRILPDAIKNLSDDSDIIFDEKSSAKPTPEIFREASVLLAPIRIGGGTSYKILESMASGTPVVTMPLSAHAIHAQDGVHLLVGENATELAEKTVTVLHDEIVYEKIAKQGRKLIEEKYTWKTLGKQLEEVYKQTV